MTQTFGHRVHDTSGLIPGLHHAMHRDFATTQETTTTHGLDQASTSEHKSRRPRRMVFFVNGDRYFRGKKVSLAPHRYSNVADLMNDLTSRMPDYLHLPHGVRQIFTPTGGQKIVDVDQLQDGQAYVVAGNETFKQIRYGGHEGEPWLKRQKQRFNGEQQDSSLQGRPHVPGYGPGMASYGAAGRYFPGGHGGSSLAAAAASKAGSQYAGYNAFPPGRYQRGGRYMPLKGLVPPGLPQGKVSGPRDDPGSMGGHGGGMMRPKIATVVRSGPKPRTVVKILLNRRGLQSLGQLMSDISEAFGPAWQSSKLRRLFTLRGREVQAVADFFKDEEVFVGLSADEINLDEVKDILQELYPDDPNTESIFREWERRQRRADRKKASQLTEGHRLTARRDSRSRYPPPVYEEVTEEQTDKTTGVTKSDVALRKTKKRIPVKGGAGVDGKEEKRDSGFEESGPSKTGEDEVTSSAGDMKAKVGAVFSPTKRRNSSGRRRRSSQDILSLADGGGPLSDEDKLSRLRVAMEERERVRNEMRKRLEAERKELEAEKRRREMPRLRGPGYNSQQDIFKRMDEEREKDRRERIKLKMETEKQYRDKLRLVQISEEFKQQQIDSESSSPKHVTNTEGSHFPTPIDKSPNKVIKSNKDESPSHHSPKKEHHSPKKEHLDSPKKENNESPKKYQNESPKTELQESPLKGSKAENEVLHGNQNKENKDPAINNIKEENDEDTSISKDNLSQKATKQKPVPILPPITADPTSTETPGLGEVKPNNDPIPKDTHPEPNEDKQPSKTADNSSRTPAVSETPVVQDTSPKHPSPKRNRPHQNNVGIPEDSIDNNSLLPHISGSPDRKKPLTQSSACPSPTKRLPKKQLVKADTKKAKLARQVSSVQHVAEKYELGRTLGDGNFAVVRHARQRDSGREYAIKVIDKRKLKGKESMIENEIFIMRACRHPNIVRLKEEYETQAEIFLVMELIKGGDLFDAITQSVKFNEPQAAGMVKSIANALYYLHSKNIVHRDLKPENLMVVVGKDNSLNLKLADFGLAMEIKTDIYTVCGTPTYVAPEILNEKGYGIEVDMWALGVITYILLSGFPPFRSAARIQTELFNLIKSGKFEFIRPYWDNVSVSVKDLINHLLVVDRKRRFTSTDVLCHPWLVTLGGSLKMEKPYNELKEILRQELNQRAQRELADFVEYKAANGR